MLKSSERRGRAHSGGVAVGLAPHRRSPSPTSSTRTARPASTATHRWSTPTSPASPTSTRRPWRSACAATTASRRPAPARPATRRRTPSAARAPTATSSGPGRRPSPTPSPSGQQHHKVVCEECHTKATPQQIGFPAGCVSCHAKEHKTVKQVAVRALPRAHALEAVDVRASRRTAARTATPARTPTAATCLRCHTTSSWANHFQHPVALGGAARELPVREVPHQRPERAGQGLQQLPRQPARRPHRLRPLPHDQLVRAVDVQPPGGRRARRRVVRLQRLPPATGTSPAPTAPATAATRRRATDGAGGARRSRPLPGRVPAPAGAQAVTPPSTTMRAAGHEAAVVARQEGHGGGELLRPADAPERVGLLHARSV